jgi:hypothetical protein
MTEPPDAPDPAAGNPDRPRDWFEFWVRFFFGTILGALCGFWLWLKVFPSHDSGWIAIPAGAVVLGLAAACYGDSFWHSLRDHVHWF